MDKKVHHKFTKPMEVSSNDLHRREAGTKEY